MFSADDDDDDDDSGGGGGGSSASSSAQQRGGGKEGVPAASRAAVAGHRDRGYAWRGRLIGFHHGGTR